MRKPIWAHYIAGLKLRKTPAEEEEEKKEGVSHNSNVIRDLLDTFILEVFI